MTFTPITIAPDLPDPVRDFLNEVDSWGLENGVVTEGEVLDYADGDLANFYEDFKLMCEGYSLSGESNQLVENTVSYPALAEYLQTVTSIEGLPVSEPDREKILALFSPNQIPISWQNLRRITRPDVTACVDISFLERNLRDFSRPVYYAPFEQEQANEAWSQQDQNNYIVISGLFRRALDYVQDSLDIPQDRRIDFEFLCGQPTGTVVSSQREPEQQTEAARDEVSQSGGDKLTYDDLTRDEDARQAIRAACTTTLAEAGGNPENFRFVYYLTMLQENVVVSDQLFQGADPQVVCSEFK